jgi:hypothetical protein
MAGQLNAERDLAEACREWRRLAEAEGEAIRTGNWGLCAACQKALQHLRERMDAILPAARADWARSGNDRPSREQRFNDTLRELIAVERRNQTLLQSVRAAAHVKIQELNLARINLKQLRRSYGFAHDAPMNSFS